MFVKKYIKNENKSCKSLKVEHILRFYEVILVYLNWKGRSQGYRVDFPPL